MAKNFKIIISFLLAGAVVLGGFVFFSGNKSLNQDILSFTVYNLVIRNPESHPQQGDNWLISFETEGTADLTIIPGDQQTINDIDFIFLQCAGEKRNPQIMADGVIFYPDWSCDEIGEISYLVNIANDHVLRFEFADKTDYAHNNPDTISDTFNNEDLISSKTNIIISAGQAKLDQQGLDCWGLDGSCDLGCNKSSVTAKLVYNYCTPLQNCGEWRRADGNPIGPSSVAREDYWVWWSNASCSGTQYYSTGALCYDTGANQCYEVCCVDQMVQVTLNSYKNLAGTGPCTNLVSSNWFIPAATGYILPLTWFPNSLNRYTVSGPAIKYTGTGTCLYGSGNCYKLSNTTTYFLVGSACGGTSCTSGSYSNQTKCTWYPNSYYTSGNFVSENLLNTIDTDSINSFIYSLSVKPAGTNATVQFSQDYINWYDSTGVLGGTNTLIIGVANSIDLSSLNWSGANFYYKINFSSDGSNTPILDEIALDYTPSVVLPAGNDLCGYAWSSNIGWASFNCFNTGTCGTSAYKVSIETDDYVSTSSHVWSSNIGWLVFDPVVAGVPPVGGYNYTGSGHLAKLEKSVSPWQLRGWARACGIPAGGGAVTCGSGDWDGWIALSDTTGFSKIEVDDIPSPDELKGWAWGGDVVGWLSFNCSNDSSCSAPGIDYKVYFCLSGTPPSAINLLATQPNYCGCASCPVISYSWTFSDPDEGDFLTAFQVQTDDTSDFSSPVDDSGKVLYPSESYATPMGKLIYNKTYYWRVKVWDKNGNESEWAEGSSFNTSLHAYPEIDFSWYPLVASVDEDIIFADESTVYGGATKKSWSWTFQDAVPVTATSESITANFTSGGRKQVNLTVTDTDDFSCSENKLISVNLPIPDYREVKPLALIKKLFDNLPLSFFKINSRNSI
ncbi:MAG: hypothetical protein ABIF89_02230 [bacterium]